MSKVCEICGKGKMTGCTVSDSNRKANRQYEVNLQPTKIEVNGTTKTVRACTKCKKTLAKKNVK